MDPAALDAPWLVLLVLGALGLAAYRWWRGRQAPREPSAGLARGSELDRLGLSEVRSRRPAGGPAPIPSVPPPPSVPAAPASAALAAVGAAEEPVEMLHEALWRRASKDAPSADAPAETSFETSNGASVGISFDETGVSAPRPVLPIPAPAPEEPAPAIGPYFAMRSSLWHTADPDAVGLLLESLCASVGAQSVALLRYDADADAYAVDALVGHEEAPRTEPFSAAGNALHRVPDDRSISLLEADALAALQYHADPVSTVGHAAALTLEGPAERVVLVADRSPGGAPFTPRHLAHLGDYADLLGRLFADPRADSPDEATGPGAADAEGAGPERGSGTVEQTPTGAPEPGEAPLRPRADIIAEEMVRARVTERPLALALVVLRDTESIERRGHGAVAEAERVLFERLRRVEGSVRVERFGELLAGVFCHAGPTFVEAWAERVAAAGPPVHVGVALLRARHLDAEALRADAAAALRDAYERGEDCVILE